jgi:hypothetical protein
MLDVYGSLGSIFTVAERLRWLIIGSGSEFQHPASLVLRSIGIVNPIVYGVVNRLEGYVLCHPRRRDPTALLLHRGLIPA